MYPQRLIKISEKTPQHIYITNHLTMKSSKEIQQTQNQVQTSKAIFNSNIMVALETNNKIEMNIALREYKTPQGQINFPAIFSINRESRLPAMAKIDLKRTFAVVLVAVTNAMESMNLIRPMNATQIMDLVDAIIETSEEDQLSIEDVMLFLQQLVRGQYGKLYESLDIPKFMDMFEQYREERWQAIRNIRDEQASSHRPSYHEERVSETFTKEDRSKHETARIDYLLKSKK